MGMIDDNEPTLAQADIEYHISTFTPFEDNGEVDFDKIEPYIKYLVKQKIDGISILGISGEGTSLTIDERKKTATAFVKCARASGIKNINIHVSSPCIKEMQELARHAESIDATSVSALPHIFHKPSCSSEIIEYLTLIAKPLKNTKLLYVNVPEVTSVYIRACELLEMGSRLPSFAGIHDSGVDLTDLSRAIWISRKYPGMSVICSRNVDITPALAIGCTKFIGPSINFCLPIYRQIGLNYKTEVGLKLQHDLLNALSICCKYGLNVPMLKACTEKVAGINLGTVRLPLRPCRAEVVQALDNELNTLNFWKHLKINSE